MRKNLLANYAGQIYAAAMNILIVPVLMKLVGAEAYGLIGFFAMIQGWLLLMDVGMSPTLGRAASRYKSGGYSLYEFRYLVKFADVIFLVTAVIFIVCSTPASGWIAKNWLKAQVLSVGDIKFSIIVMLVAVAIRWRTQPHRSIIIGMEQQIWMNAFNSIIVTLRTIGAALFVVAFGNGVKLFFSYQLAIAIVEALGMFWKVRRLVPKSPSNAPEVQGQKPDLKAFWSMSLTLMLTTTAWTLLTQLDRLVLSKKIALADFGVFSMAVLCASGIMTLSGPITGVLGPRLTIMIEKMDRDGVLALYRSSTRFAVSIVLNAAITVAFFSDQLVWIWCNNKDLAAKAAPILFWYALGNGFQSMTALFYNLQYAHGKLRLHLVGYMLLTAIVSPTVVWAASRYGAVGTGQVWFAQSVLYLVGWGFIVHGRFLPGYYPKWLLRDILPGLVPVVIVAWMLRNIPIPWGQSRIADIAYFAGCVSVCVSVSFISNVDFRNIAKSWVRARRLSSGH